MITYEDEHFIIVETDGEIIILEVDNLSKEKVKEVIAA